MKAGDIVISRMTANQKWGTAILRGEYKMVSNGFIWYDVQIIGNSHRELHECCAPLDADTWKLIGTKKPYKK